MLNPDPERIFPIDVVMVMLNDINQLLSDISDSDQLNIVLDNDT